MSIKITSTGHHNGQSLHQKAAIKSKTPHMMRNFFIPVMALALAMIAPTGMCQSEKSIDSNLSSKSRDAFIGRWKGKYHGLDDVMKIEAGKGPKSVVVTIHAEFENPDKVKGTLESASQINIPEQSMGGKPGTAVIKLEGGKLRLSQKMSGDDVAFEGIGYEKQVQEKAEKVEEVKTIKGIRATAVGKVSTTPFWDGRKKTTKTTCHIKVELRGKEAQKAYSIGPVQGVGIASNGKKVKIDDRGFGSKFNMVDRKQHPKEGIGLNIKFDNLPKNVSGIKSVQGSVTVLTGGKEKIVAIPNILKVSNGQLAHSALAATSIKISYDKRDFGDDVQLDFEMREGSVGFVELKLVDARGKQVKGYSWGSSISDNMVTFNARGTKAKFKGLALQIVIREGSKKVILPFKAKVGEEKKEAPSTSLFKYHVIDGAIMIAGYSDKEVEEIIIPAKIKGKPVTRIGNSAFQQYANLKKVTIPEGVTKIGATTFNGCKNLTSITIPDTVKSFGFGAFQHSGLTSLTLPSGIKSLPTATFAFCKNLTSLTVPKGVTRIGQYTFGICPKLKEIIFLGNAPTFHADALKDSTPTIYRKSGAKGWGETWAGRPVKLIGATK
ncbi:leucine-rich repeat domain-containing protein [Rubritalea profundi]|nr:leucine-rich repeat domain-containing protein [Rubritalea profundi]